MTSDNQDAPASARKKPADKVAKLTSAAEPELASFDSVISADAGSAPAAGRPKKSRAERKKEKAEKKAKAAEDGEKPRGLAGTRLVAVIAGVAVASLLAGVLLMQFIVSPAEVAARSEAPEPGPVTAPITQQVISNEIKVRGTVVFAGAQDVKLDTGGITERPIVTGQVPEVGATFNAGSVALEVAGRPVLVLPGELPAYRSLSIGSSGPDVLQLKQALAGLGYNPGDVNSNYYEWQTAEAVGMLYQNAGYQPSTGGPEAQEAQRSAQKTFNSAQNEVNKAERANSQAYNAGEDTTDTWAAVEEARTLRDEAWQALEEANQAVQPSLPAGEVLFLKTLPMRVDAVYVERGADVAANAVMAVSGADLTIESSVSKEDATLLEPGMTANYSTPGGEALTATITEIVAPAAASGDKGNDGSGDKDNSDTSRYKLILDPGELTEEQATELRNANVLVTIPIESTDGEVLAVPVAALFATPDGSYVVEILEPTKDDPFHTERVPVKENLSADGMVEITSDDARIKPGAKVVVGQ